MDIYETQCKFVVVFARGVSGQGSRIRTPATTSVIDLWDFYKSDEKALRQWNWQNTGFVL